MNFIKHYLFALHRRLKVLITKPRWITVTKGSLKGVNLFLHPEINAMWKKMSDANYDTFIYSALNHNRTDEIKTIWDVGAHIGYHTLGFANTFPECQSIVSFEPNPSNIIRLNKNIAKNPLLAKRISVLNCALANVDGDELFLFTPDVDIGTSSGSCLDTATPPIIKSFYSNFKKTQVATFKGDSLVDQNTIKAPNMIKIDVEGAELLVLEGCHNIIDSYHPLLFIEIHHVLMMYYVQDFLLRKNYKIELLDKENAIPSRCFILAKHNNSFKV